jgi:hypothetical protein
VVTPQVTLPPAVTRRQLRPPITLTGVLLKPPPLPSCPKGLLPQQNATSNGVTAQVCVLPALTLRKRRPPVTGTGMFVWTSSPPLPRGPGAPQHQARWSVVMAQVCSKPALIWTNRCPPATRTGQSPPLKVPLPSWPSAFEPQHQAAPLVSRAQV